MSQNSTPDTPTEATEESRSIKRSQVHTVFTKSTHDEDDTSEHTAVTEFESPKENGEQNIIQENKLLGVSTNFAVQIHNQKLKGL